MDHGIVPRRVSRVTNHQRQLRARTLLACVLIAAIGAATAGAQFQIHHWASFEDGAIPADAVSIAPSRSSTLRVADMNTLPGMPPAFRSPEAIRENGRFCLMIRTLPQEEMLTGMGTGVVLQRDLLGASGRALFQADFFVPAPGERSTTMAVLAMVPDSKPSIFYRWGISKRGHFFFSHVKGGAAAATLSLTDEKLFKNMPRPGWHRMSMLFEGSSRIRCYVDGQEASFSPVEDSELRQLQVGIMLAEKNDDLAICVDNISVQWTMDDSPLPESPYRANWPKTSAAAAAPAPAAKQAINWLSPEEGNFRAARESKPFFVCFQIPQTRPTQRLENLLADTPAARAYLDRHVPVAVDVNQLQGSTLAKQLNIVQVPSIVICTPEGRETGRIAVSPNDTWESLAPQLESIAPPRPPAAL